MMEFQFVERVWITRAVTLHIDWMLINESISCKLAEISTYMEAGIRGCLEFAHQAFAPGPPSDP